MQVAVDTRARMIGAATGLLSQRGYDGTGFREVVAQARAARGAIYHHFPGGKQQLGVDVASTFGGGVAAVVEQLCAELAPEVALASVLDLAEQYLVRGGAVPGCPVAAVALAADDPDGQLRAAADAAFTRWRAAFAGCLARNGTDTERAAAFATLVVAAIEGAVVLCRAHGDTTPYADVRAALLEQLPRLT